MGEIADDHQGYIADEMERAGYEALDGHELIGFRQRNRGYLGRPRRSPVRDVPPDAFPIVGESDG